MELSPGFLAEINHLKWAAVNILWRVKMIYILRCMRLHPDTAHLALHRGSLVSVRCEGGEKCLSSHRLHPGQSKQKQISPSTAVGWFISSSVPTFDYLLTSVSTTLFYLQTNNSNMLQSVRNLILAHSLHFGGWEIKFEV